MANVYVDRKDVRPRVGLTYKLKCWHNFSNMVLDF